MPKIDIATVPARQGVGYSSPLDTPCAARTRRRLGDPCGGCRINNGLSGQIRALTTGLPRGCPPGQHPG